MIHRYIKSDNLIIDINENIASLYLILVYLKNIDHITII